MLCHHSCSKDNPQVNAIGLSLYVVYSKKNMYTVKEHKLIMLSVNKIWTVVVIHLIKDQDFLWIPFLNFNRAWGRKFPYSLLPLSKESKDNQLLLHIQLLNNCKTYTTW